MGGSAWIAALGEEVVYEADFPACCARSARVHDDSFECPDCGAMWRKPLPVVTECDAFARGGDEQRGAA